MGLWGGLGDYCGWKGLEKRGGSKKQKEEVAGKYGGKEEKTEREERALNGLCSSSTLFSLYFIIR